MATPANAARTAWPEGIGEPGELSPADIDHRCAELVELLADAIRGVTGSVAAVDVEKDDEINVA